MAQIGQLQRLQLLLVMQREYFVTYHGLAHAHNRWIPESKLLLEAPKLLAKFKRKLQVTTRWKRDWSIPHRLLLKREIVFSKQNDQHFDGHGDNGSNCRYEWLVKWRGLGYDNATWELDDASFLTSPEGRKVIDDYESRRKRAERLSKNHFEANEERKASFSELSVLPTGDSPGFYNQHLTYVNKLRMCWHKGQSALIVDDQIDQDLHELRCITWEAIIIDECQQSRLSGHLDDIKILKAEMRLLLVSGQIKEDQADYIKLLSLLKSGQHGSSIAQVETYFSASSTISNLKSQLEKYVVFKCKSGSTRFVEYWVPACLSHLQLEQYCSMLLSNLMLLCSGQKSDSVDALHDLIISIRKCCDHPYLLNPELQSFVTKGLPDEERLNIGIQASGKLQLLEKILLEARSRGLRVLILFQDSASSLSLKKLQSTCGSGSIGDILDDVLCQRFGKDCYVRYDRGYTPKSKQAALDTFNDGESGKFVFLMENRACLSSVKLSSVDTVILFDSDLEPQNDLRGLQRMSISSQFKQITVFRLYSFFTVEEKILMLAKEGIALDSNVRLLSQSICPTLLKWGASYLFNKLDDLHASVVSTPDTVDMSLLCDTTSELSSQLVCGADDTDCHGWSFISRIQQNGGEYARDVLLPGERIMKSGGEPCGFSWSDLEGRHPKWKFLPVSSQRIRNTVKHFDYGLRESECEKYTFIEKRTASKDNVDPKRRKVSKDNADPEWSKWTMNKVDPKRRKVSNDVVDSKGREVSRNIVDSKYWKTRLKSKKNTSVVNRANKSNGHPLTNETTGKIATNMQFSEKKNPPDIRNLPKPDISGLCDILRFSCWLAACLLEHEIDMKDSLALAKLYLNFDCKEEEATDVYSELWKHVKDFSNCVQNGLCVEKCNRSGASDSNMPELNDLAEEEKQKDFLGTCVSKLVKSVTNELNLQMKSPTTVVSQDLSCTHEICLSPNTPGSFPVEGDAISMESGSEDDRVNAITLITAEDSSVDHGSNDVNPVTGSLERQSPIRSTDITQSDGNVFEDPQILVNKVVAIDNGMNMSTHSAQLDSVEADAGTSASTAVPEVRRWYSVMSPVCDESTALKFPETTLPYMQPSDSNLWPLPQMAMSAIPSFPENNAASTVMPLDDIFRHSGEDHRYIHEAEVILEAPKDLNSSFVSPVIPQPFTSVPMNENATNSPHGITIPGFMNSDYSEAHSVTSEVSHLAYTDPLLGEMSIIENMNEEAFIDLLPIEMERIEKEKEEAFKIHEQKILQLQSDYEKEVEKLSVKYKMLLQNVNTEVALKRTELETQCELVLRNKVLAQVWTHNLDSCEGDVVQCTEQGTDHE
ncbi:hypothetical protein JHK85_008068 [Glycine max]|nr:hypothetical protein JHK85_008068 [Glycine max]